MSTKLRSVAVRFSLLGRLAGAAVPAALFAATALTQVACADENDPKTWVKRLDDPAQRSAAIKRLGQFFEDTMSKPSVNKNRDAPEVKELLDTIVEPMSNTYTAGNLDEKTRKELAKSLADMRDPRAAPAMAKAFNDFEPGKNEEDIKYAAQWVTGLASQGKLTDKAVIDALWNCFAKFQPSKSQTKSINLVTDLHDAVLAVKDPSYGPKAVEKLSAPVTNPDDPDQNLDQLQFWQKTACQVIKELKFPQAAKPLAKVILTPTKGALRPTCNAALMVIPKEGEAALIGALNGSDADLAKMMNDVPDGMGPALVADSISWISRIPGRDAVLSALDKANNDTNRTLFAQALTRFPPDARVRDAFFATYKKLNKDSKVKIPGQDELYARPALVQVASAFYDPSLTDWVLGEVSKSKGDEGVSMQAKGLEAALKLMDKGHTRAVGAMVDKLWTAQEKELFKGAQAVTEKCDKDANCYLATFDQPVGSSPGDKLGAIKAARMAATYGNDATKQALLSKVDKVKDGEARLAMVEAIDYLAGPKGDNAASDALEKVVAGDVASGNKNLIMGDDAVVKVANRLRARALP